MKKKTTTYFFSMLLILSCVFSAPLFAAEISYQLTDLTADTENLWQIDYTITDFDASTYAGFQILFGYDSYESITLLSGDDSWDTLIFQTEDVYGYEEDGALDAESLIADGILSGSFTVTVTYLGDDLPGSQVFELYDFDYQTVASGVTSSVPLPGAFFLLFSGLAGLVAARKRNNP